MNEQEVAQWLEGALADLCLRVQVKAQPLQDSPGDYALAILLNRPADSTPNYEQLSAWFQKAIASRYPQVKRLALYSRPIGQRQADWQTQVSLVPELKSAWELDLSKTASCSPPTCLNLRAWCARRSWVFIASRLGKKRKFCPCCPPCSATPAPSPR